jgi:hypothetical protein
MKEKTINWPAILIAGFIAASFCPETYARDPGVNQPGAAGGRAGVGALPGAGAGRAGAPAAGAAGRPGSGVGALPGAGAGRAGVPAAGAPGRYR